MNPVWRWARHLWLDADDVRRLLSANGLQRLQTCVSTSEARHRGELRVCVEGGLPLGHLLNKVSSKARAIELFSALKVWDTEHNNGVLIYLLVADHRIEILADRGLSQRVPPAIWDGIVTTLSADLHAGAFEAGLLKAIEQVGELMRQHYPSQDAQDAGKSLNPNELPDAVVVL